MCGQLIDSRNGTNASLLHKPHKLRGVQIAEMLHDSWKLIFTLLSSQPRTVL